MDKRNFCYKVMPLDLKNARATYQRLMDWIFKDHIRNQLEVYVNNIMVNSRTELRLNPKKCLFGVKAGKFLGFMLTMRGIEANLEKCNAVIDMRSPRSVKKVQQLTGSVIVQKEEGEERPIYYVSKVLQGPDTKNQDGHPCYCCNGQKIETIFPKSSRDVPDRLTH
ncbi:Retrovirus-related Pol polyprotein from transposon opus, partial [Mucuna pruriens]